MPIPEFIDLVKNEAKTGMRVCEVGVFDGDSTQAWMPTVKEMDGLGIGIDSFTGNPTAHGQHSTCPPDVRDRLLARMVPFGAHFQLLQGWSWEVLAMLPDRSLDVCFIDADHRYSCVSRDLKIAVQKVKVGGILCGHDLDHHFDKLGTFSAEALETDSGHAGVAQAVYEIFGDTVEMPGGSCWVKRIEG